MTVLPETLTSDPTNARAAAARSSSRLSSRNSLTGGHDDAPQFSAKWMRLSKLRASVGAKVRRRASSSVKLRASPAGDRRSSACSTSSRLRTWPATSYVAPVAPEKKAVRASGLSSGDPRTTVAWSTIALYKLIQKASPTLAPSISGSRRAMSTKFWNWRDVFREA